MTPIDTLIHNLEQLRNRILDRRRAAYAPGDEPRDERKVT